VNSITGFRRVVGAAQSGDILAIFLYDPEADVRTIRTVRTEQR
jgi:hypothetical protein